MTMPSSSMPMRIKPQRPESGLKTTDENQRRAVLESARAEIQRRLQAHEATRVAPCPAPRYDEVFFEGTAYLDNL